MAAARRLKTDGTIPITGWGQADDLVREIGKLQRRIEDAQNYATAEIEKIKAGLAKEVKTSQEQIKKILASLEVFAGQHKAEFGGQKTWKLNFGTLGWRKSTITIVGKKTLEFIKQFLSSNLQKELIRTREFINKEAVGKLTEEQLAEIEARREEKDIFFVEPNKVEAADLK